MGILSLTVQNSLILPAYSQMADLLESGKD